MSDLEEDEDRDDPEGLDELDDELLAFDPEDLFQLQAQVRLSQLPEVFRNPLPGATDEELLDGLRQMGEERDRRAATFSKDVDFSGVANRLLRSVEEAMERFGYKTDFSGPVALLVEAEGYSVRRVEDSALLAHWTPEEGCLLGQPKVDPIVRGESAELWFRRCQDLWGLDLPRTLPPIPGMDC